MNDLPPYVATLLAAQRIAASQLPANSRKLLQPLIDGGVLEQKMAGRGDVLIVQNSEAFAKWVEHQFPASTGIWSSSDRATRAQSIVQRRDSKAAGRSVAQSVLHLRAPANSKAGVVIDGVALPVSELTAKHGLAASLIHETSKFEFHGRMALIENLEFFLHADPIIPQVELILNSAGRISDRLITCLANSDLGAYPLLHLPDYDPVGLSDYLRLHRALGKKVILYVPTDLKERFTHFGNSNLLVKKRRNRELLEQLNTTKWPCETSAEVFRLIRETGCGLEQEALLLERKSATPVLSP